MPKSKLRIFYINIFHAGREKKRERYGQDSMSGENAAVH